MGVETRAQLTAGEAKLKAVSEEDPVGSRLTKMEELIEEQNQEIDRKFSEMLEAIRSNRFEKVLDDPVAELKQLKETNGIVEYHKKFELLSTRVNLTEDYLVRVYLDGLQIDTQVNVQMFQPQTIRQCFLIGKFYEYAHPRSNIDNVGILPLKRDSELKAKEDKEEEKIEVEMESIGLEDNLVHGAILEEESTPQFQVSIANSEILKNVELMEVKQVVQNREYVVMHENLEQEWVQKNIDQIFEVEGDVERSPEVLSIEKICYAHQVFGKMSQHKERLGIKKKTKWFKSWRFKFKQRKPRSDWHRTAHKLIYREDVMYKYICSNAKVALMKKKEFSKTWSMLKDDCFRENDQVYHETLPIWLLIRFKFWKFKIMNRNLQKLMPQIEEDMRGEVMDSRPEQVSHRSGRFMYPQVPVSDSDHIMNNRLQSHAGTNLFESRIGHGVDMLILPKMLVHDNEMTRLPPTSLIICDFIRSFSQANYVWKPGGLTCIQDQWDWLSHVHTCGIIVKIAQRLYGTNLSTKMLYSPLTDSQTWKMELGSLTMNSSVGLEEWKHGFDIYGYEYKKQMLFLVIRPNRVWERGRLLATQVYWKWLENYYKCDRVLKCCYLFEMSFVERKAYGKELLVVGKKLQRSHALFPSCCAFQNKSLAFTQRSTCIVIVEMNDKMQGTNQSLGMAGSKKEIRESESWHSKVNTKLRPLVYLDDMFMFFVGMGVYNRRLGVETEHPIHQAHILEHFVKLRVVDLHSTLLVFLYGSAPRPPENNHSDFLFEYALEVQSCVGRALIGITMKQRKFPKTWSFKYKQQRNFKTRRISPQSEEESKLDEVACILTLRSRFSEGEGFDTGIRRLKKKKHVDGED